MQVSSALNRGDDGSLFKLGGLDQPSEYADAFRPGLANPALPRKVGFHGGGDYGIPAIMETLDAVDFFLTGFAELTGVIFPRNSQKTRWPMSLNYEDLDFRPTPIGNLMLRRRRMPQFGERDLYEVKLGEDFLMTSLFHEAESQLAKRGMAALTADAPTKQQDAILLDIDHTPTNVLHQTNTHFYTETGLREMMQHLKPGGIFAM